MMDYALPLPTQTMRMDDSGTKVVSKALSGLREEPYG